MAGQARHDPHPRQALSPDDPGQDRTLPPLDEEPDPARELLPARSARSAPGRVRRLLQLAPLPRESQQPDPGRRLLRPRSRDSVTEGKCQTENHPRPTPAAPSCSQNFYSDGPDPLLIPMPTCPIGSDDVQLNKRSVNSTVRLARWKNTVSLRGENPRKTNWSIWPPHAAGASSLRITSK